MTRTSNTFPLTTFNWVGIDGTQILTHMTPVVNYNSQCKYEDIVKAHRNHENLAVSPDSMLLYGLGDGGGGPTFEMLERLNRARAVGLQNDPKGAETPLIRMGGSMLDFFKHVQRTTDQGSTLPSWVGELYLEAHRGTYTSQASTKRGNRKGEILMREVELAATLASITPNTQYLYPHKLITRCWEALCLCQFHDTLPGSSIAICVRDSDGKYAELQDVGRRLLDEAYGVLYGTSMQGEERRGAGALIINTLHMLDRREVIAMPNSPGVRPKQQQRKGAQLSSDGERTFVLVESQLGAPCHNLQEGGAGEVKGE